MSILKVNNISTASSGTDTVTFTENVTFSKAVNISSGSITASFDIANASIEKEKLTNDARDFVNILNKPAGLISSSGQFVTAISGSSLELGGILATGSIRTTSVFSGSGAQLFGIPNAALNNSQITINGTAVSLGGSRTLSTTDVAEGTNLYYTDTRVKNKLDNETVVSSSNQINYQAIQGQPTVNTLGGDGNQSFTITTGIFVTASGGADGIIITNDTPNYTLRFRTVGGTVSSSAQVAASLPAGTVSSSTQVKANLPGGTVSSSTQVVAGVASQTIAPTTVNATNITASALTANQAVFTNASDGLVSNAITGTGNVVMSASPTLTGTITAQNITATGTMLLAGIVSQSSQIDYNSITNKLSGVVSASGQVKPLLPGGTVTSSAQYPGWVTASSQIDVRNTTGIATIATTGSNTFIGNQTVSGSFTLTGNLNVLGSSSVLYTTASELVVGDNKIVVNSTDAFRFAGLQIIDSGSASPTTASFYWDSLNHKFIYENLSGSDYNSAIFLAGPKNTGTLGNEPVLTTGRIPVATGEDHLDNRVQSSSIRVDFTTRRTDIEAGLYITGSTTASGHIVPSTTDIYDLGSPTLKFRDLYLSGSTLYLGTLAIRDNGGSLSIGPSGSAIGTNSPVSGAFTGSFRGNGSQLTNISNAALPGGIISSSTQLPAGTVSSSAQYPGWVTASSQIDYNSITNKLSGVYSSSTQIANNLPAGTVSSSGQINAGATANFATAVAAQLGGVHSASFLGTATTNNLAEGVTNLYYTDARVKAKLSNDVVHSGSFLGTATTDNLTQGSTNRYYANSLVLNYINSLSVLSSSQQVVDRLPTGTVSSSTQIAAVQVTSASYALTASLAIGVSGSLAVSTDGLNEGTINLYYTDARVKNKLNVENVHSASFLGTATTTNLTEGVNLYFTNARAIAALPGAVSSSTQVQTLLPGGTLSSSAQYPGWVTASSQIDYNSIQNKLSGVVSSSTQVKPLLPGGTVTSSAQYPGWVTASSQIDYNSITNKLSGVVSASGQVQPLLPGGTVSSSAQYPGWVTSSGQIDYNSIQNKLSGVASSSTQVVSLVASQNIAPASVNATFITASSLTVNQAVFTNGSDGLVSNAITGTGNVVMSASPTLTGTLTAANITANGTLLLQNIVSQSSSPSFTALTVTNAVSATAVTASGLTANQAVFTNASDGLVSNAITGTGNVVMSASPTLTGTITAQNITATGTMLLAGIVSSSTQIDYNSIQNKLSGVYSSSVQSVASLAGQYIVPSGSNFQGVVSGSGNQYRLVVPVGTNLYAL
jgi:hypothetical protein